MQRLVPALDGDDDGVRIFGPMEEPWYGVGLGDEAVDGFLERDKGVEDVAFQAALGQLGKEAFNRIQPECRGRGEAECPAGMPTELLLSWLGHT
jgi:hypothetical protein